MALLVFGVLLSANTIGGSYCWPYSLDSDCVVDVCCVAVAIVVLLLVNHSESAGCVCVLCVLVGTRLVEEDFSFVFVLEQNLWTKIFLLFLMLEQD